MRRLLQWLLLAAAIAYLGYYLRDQWLALRADVTLLEPWLLLAGSLAVAGMLALKSLYHLVVLRRLGHSGPPAPAAIVSAYALSQVVRYLPGKVLGVIFEAERLAPHIPAHRVVAANIIQSLYTMALTFGVLGAAAVWLFDGGPWLAWLACVSLVVATWSAHRLHLVERAMFRLASRIPRLREYATLPATSSRWSLRAALILLCEWLPYFLFWALLLPADEDPFRTAILLGSCYAGASLAANFAVIAPSGLFVREAIFLWMGSQLAVAPSTVILLGMAARLAFTMADLLFAALAWGAEAITRRGVA
ncbi:hypothetical protein [Arenimonas composti]|uniref:Flippase-like domain-containing protein n=1 Tax=Arenimonas composti TR7-09 = DSM 18010 TaxID=1121013 RepID=A0A091C3M2_9GAMM|nr:hypothetical protein [Arenimonas composti]KFN51260.1 hypothetical protein P873_03065 [Arenimonas composti TR7-09 = DSM 18010]